MDVAVPALLEVDGEDIVVVVAAEDVAQSVGVDPTRIMSLLTSTHACLLRNAVSFMTAALPTTQVLRTVKQIRVAILDRTVKDHLIRSRLMAYLMPLVPMHLVPTFAICWRMLLLGQLPLVELPITSLMMEIAT